ncbi:MAG: CBS domain-containing protein [Cyanophyceae cyanobacterium]
MKASDIMTREVVTIDGAATVAEASQLMKRSGVRALIVNRINEADAYGIVSETDIIQKVVAIGANPQQVKVGAVMTKPCIVVNPGLAVEYIAGLFTRAGICRAPVVRDKLLGIISVTDLLALDNFRAQLQFKNAHSLLKQLEELEREESPLEVLPTDVYDAWCSG